jgi:hypothetical protein
MLASLLLFLAERRITFGEVKARLLHVDEIYSICFVCNFILFALNHRDVSSGKKRSCG